MIRLFASAAVLALALAAPAAAQQLPPASVTTQLPRVAAPIHYDVTVTPLASALKPDAADGMFAGSARIDLQIVTATDALVLNAADLSFGAVQLLDASGKPVATPKVTNDAKAQTASFAFGRTIAPGRYTLTADYRGKVYLQAAGLFALDYDGAHGRERAIYTQFENSDARRFVPSFDEPAYKATFSLHAIVPAGEMTVGNMPVAKRTPVANGQVRVDFATTPKMSTYLLFFGLGDFDRATKMAGATEIGVITKKGDASKADFALASATAILPWYNDYFGTPFPLPKLDNIAAPGRSQFFSAMENWGAIFTFEGSLLVDPAISTQADKQRIFTTAAHEMAHQWFGDLVTMQWWDDLWLNEGFASWMESRASQHFHPEWDPELETVGARNRAMAQDALATTHPIIQHVTTVEQASQAFDSITYQKGESVIRMLEAYAGSDQWRDGVRRYMAAHAHGNTVTDDLWREIDAAGPKKITAIAHDFTLQPGIPMIHVDAATCAAGKTTLTLSQSEFALGQGGKAARTWRVPVIAATVGGAPASTLVERGHGALTLAGCGPVVVNAGGTGYYRTLYARPQFAALVAAYRSIAPIDQLGLLADAASLGLAGRQPMADALDLIQAMPAGAKPQLFEAAAATLLTLYDYARGDDARQAALRAYAIRRLSPRLAALGWAPRAGETDNDAILRTELIATLGRMRDPAVVTEARRRFDASAKNPAEIAPTLRRTVLGVVAYNADAATWERVHAMAKVAPTALVKAQYYALLATPADPALAAKALALAISAEPPQTSSSAMIREVSLDHPDLALDFALANREAVEARVDSSSLPRYVPQLASASTDPAAIAKVKAYAEAHLAAGSRRGAEEAEAAIANRIAVRRDRLPEIDAWLAAHRS